MVEGAGAFHPINAMTYKLLDLVPAIRREFEAAKIQLTLHDH